jgi:uncharacterized membrane protein
MRLHRRFNPSHAIASHFRNTLAAGVVVILPIGITILIFKFFFDLLDPLLLPLFRKWVPGPDPPGLGLASLLVLVYLVGLTYTHGVGRRVVEMGHNLMEAIPVVRGIYSTARSAVELLAPSGKDQPYSAVVLIDFPSPGLKSIGFVTANLGVQDGEEMLAVYVPTPPTPSTGVLIMIAAKEVTPMPISVDDALKVIISCGLLARDIHVPLSATSPSPFSPPVERG